MHATARYGRLKTYNNSDNRAHAVSAQAYRRFFPANSEIKLPGGGVEGVEPPASTVLSTLLTHCQIMYWGVSYIHYIHTIFTPIDETFNPQLIFHYSNTEQT